MYRIDRELTTYFFGATFDMNTGFRVIISGDQIFEAQPFKQKLAVFIQTTFGAIFSLDKKN